MNPDHVDKNLAPLAYTEQPLFIQIHQATIGEGVLLRPFCNLYGCTIGRGSRIGAYTEIGTDVHVGQDCKIGAYVFIPQGITVEDEVFIGPGVVFCNDKHPHAVGEWNLLHTVVRKGASIGAGCVVMPGIVIGENAMIGAGSLVLRNILPNETYYNKRK